MRPITRVLGLAGLAAICAFPGTAGAATPITFGAPLVLPTGLNPGLLGPVAVGDLDGDGANDLIASAADFQKPATIVVFRGDGTGKFAAPKAVVLGTLAGKNAVGDVNGDGRADLLVRTDEKHMQVQFSQPAGAFAPGPAFKIGTFAQPVLTDINGDGSLDIVTTDVNRITSYLGDSHGAFAPPIVQTVTRKVSSTSAVSGYGETTPAVADFNEDGHPDLAVGTMIAVRHKAAHHRTRTTLESVAAVIPGRGDGHFGRVVVTRVGKEPTLWEPQAADFNGDGLPDLAAGAVTHDDQIEAALVMLGHGHGHFAKARCYGFPSCKSFVNESGTFGYDDVSLGDFDANGTIDIAVVEFDLGYPRILSGDGHGGFAAQLLKGVPFNNVAAATGDLNRDASSDLVLFNGAKVTVVPGAAK